MYRFRVFVSSSVLFVFCFLWMVPCRARACQDVVATVNLFFRIFVDRVLESAVDFFGSFTAESNVGRRFYSCMSRGYALRALLVSGMFRRVMPVFSWKWFPKCPSTTGWVFMTLNTVDFEILFEEWVFRQCKPGLSLKTFPGIGRPTCMLQVEGIKLACFFS